jgi:peptidoglycan-associated lipoprotein
MKTTTFVNLMAIGMALTFVSAGCKHKPVRVTNIPNSRSGIPGNDLNTTPIVPDGGAGGIPPGGDFPTAQGNPGDWSNAKRDSEMFKSDTVYFAFDSSVVRSGEKSKIAHVADFLKSNPASGVEVDGHCDERGTDEYNRSLGERRALAIREELILLGVDGTKVLTVSFGKDRPLDLEHTEAAFAKNRRGEFILLTQ